MGKTFEVKFTETYTIHIEADSAEEAIEKSERIHLEDWEFENSGLEATDKSGMTTSELLDWLKEECPPNASPDDVDCFDYRYIKDDLGHTWQLCVNGLDVWGFDYLDHQIFKTVEQFQEQFDNRWFF